MESLPGASVTVAPMRSDMARWAGGGIILSSLATRYQLGLIRYAASVMAPPRASRARFALPGINTNPSRAHHSRRRFVHAALTAELRPGGAGLRGGPGPR
jgi:hypothetical protein